MEIPRDRWRPRTKKLTDALTQRELEILHLRYSGLSREAAARQLGISVRTLDTHTGNIYRKLNVHYLLDAIKVGIRDGVLEPMEADAQ